MKIPKILIVDDELNTLKGLQLLFQKRGIKTDIASSENKAIELFKNLKHDIILTDLHMEREDSGIRILKEVKSIKPDTIVFLLTAFGEKDSFKQAIDLGAHDYFSKPINFEVLSAKIEFALSKVFLSEQVDSQFQMIGESSAMKSLKEKILKISKNDKNVFITGEKGTGKELVARAIFKTSHRAQKPFIPVNVAAISDELLANEMFGHSKGAYTSAGDSHKGFFEIANNGTLFLDEIGNLSLKAQQMLLRVLADDRDFHSLGNVQSKKTNVRLITATNKDLTKSGFMPDLLDRLLVLPIHLPPLRERKEDIPLLVKHFVSREIPSAISFDVFDQNSIELLMENTWPGNIRQLKNFVERALIEFPDQKITPTEIYALLSGVGSTYPPSPGGISLFEIKKYKEAKNQFEKGYIKRRLNIKKGVVKEAAKEMDLTTEHLYQKIKSLDIDMKEFR